MITDMGVTVAVQASNVQGLNPTDLRDEVRNLAEQAQEGLRLFVGGARPYSDLAINWEGPQYDPIQGPIYALTVAAKFNTDDLPADCDAYRIYVTERNRP